MASSGQRHSQGPDILRSHSEAYRALLRAGSHLRPLQQVHACIIISGSRHSLPLLTKLATFAIAAGSISYTHHIFSSIPIPDSFLFNSLIRICSKHSFPLHSILFYHRMIVTGIPPSSYSFTSVVKACADSLSSRSGRAIHGQILTFGYQIDSFVQAALVSFYARITDLNRAREVFDKMSDRHAVAWNSMIAGYEQNGYAQKAVNLFNSMMNSGIKPDSSTFVTLLSACSQLGSIELGRWVDEYIARNNIKVDVSLGASIINMYVRCGTVSRAREVFDQMQERNVVAWTAMISGYGVHGYANQALELFHEMRTRGPSPNSVTFVAVLSACAHGGFIHEGRRLIASMKTDYGLTPGVEHHVCMVDMLGRAGLLHDALGYIEALSPNEDAPAMWTALLGACKMHKNFDLGERIAERLLFIEPDNSGHYVLLSNIYASSGRMDLVECIRNMMINRGLKKMVGYSAIEIGMRMHMFSNGDRSHPQSMEIFQYLDELIRRSREVGYVPSMEMVMHELEEEERELALRYHSEKLAIAFGLMKTCNDVTIRIVKNLRICEDCHSAIKFFSVVTNREIIVRDKLRFHHFREGSCSCFDYW